MSDWEARITAPNGANGHFTATADEGVTHLIGQVDKFIRSVEKADADQLAGLDGAPADAQPVRQARSPRR